MHTIYVYDSEKKLSIEEKAKTISFLHEHLGKYGDSKEHIRKAIDYALQEFESFGGAVYLLKREETILGCVVVNKTGMGGYIPENILVYIATHQNNRGEGLGKTLMQYVIYQTRGAIALHVEANNPAKILYEKFGFTNPYLEMRLQK